MSDVSSGEGLDARLQATCERTGCVVRKGRATRLPASLCSPPAPYQRYHQVPLLLIASVNVWPC